MDKFVFAGEDIKGIEEIDPSVRPIVETTEAFLAKKRNFVGEIIVTLFEDCNLSCKFCNQDHNSVVGLDNIVGKADDVIRAIKLLQKMRKTEFSIHLMGGEIFQDKFDQSVYTSYKELVFILAEYCRMENIPVNFVFVSNLIHFNTSRVKQLLDTIRSNSIDVSLATSYDPSMRFSPADLIVFAKNLEIYKADLSIVNVVLTAPNIRKFLSSNTPHFDFIYEHFDVFFDYYTPEENHELMSPKDHELRDMFVFLTDKYPKVHPIVGWVENETNAMSCQSTYTIQPDGRAGRCTILLSEFQKPKAPKTAGEMEHEFITKMDCLSCEFFSRCGLGCFLQQHFNGPNRTMNDCWMKDVHSHIAEKKNVR